MKVRYRTFSRKQYQQKQNVVVLFADARDRGEPRERETPRPQAPQGGTEPTSSQEQNQGAAEERRGEEKAGMVRTMYEITPVGIKVVRVCVAFG